MSYGAVEEESASSSSEDEAKIPAKDLSDSNTSDGGDSTLASYGAVESVSCSDSDDEDHSSPVIKSVRSSHLIRHFGPASSLV
jgi:hypothetical protein